MFSMNIEKTNYIVFYNEHEIFVASIGINGINLPRVYLANCLGVFIDHKLS